MARCIPQPSRCPVHGRTISNGWPAACNSRKTGHLPPPHVWHPICDAVARMSKLLSAAFLLLVIWVVLKVALAITSVTLHLLWIIAVILAVFWLFGKIRGTK